MSIQMAYTNWSTTYDEDQNLTRDLDQAVTRRVLGDRHYQSVLELGCGTGKNTAFLAEIGRNVHALDFSEGVIDRAREKVRASHVTFAVADLSQSWQCADRSADLIVCNLVLEHLSDLGFIFAEAARVLTPGGQFFLCELHPFRQYGGTKANFQNGGETTEIQAFVHHVSDFTDAAQARGLALKNFKEWWHEEDAGKPPRLVSFRFAKPGVRE